MKIEQMCNGWMCEPSVMSVASALHRTCYQVLRFRVVLQNESNGCAMAVQWQCNTNPMPVTLSHRKWWIPFKFPTFHLQQSYRGEEKWFLVLKCRHVSDSVWQSLTLFISLAPNRDKCIDCSFNPWFCLWVHKFCRYIGIISDNKRYFLWQILFSLPT